MVAVMRASVFFTPCRISTLSRWQQQRPPVLPPPPPPSRIIAPPYDGIHFASGLRSQKRAQWLLQPGCDSSHASGSRRAMSSQLREGGAEGMRAKQPYFLGQKNENVVERMGSSACSNGVAAACTEEEPGAALELKTGPYGFPQAPVFLKGKVVTGFGRGGKLLGVPTANLDPEHVNKDIVGVQFGIFFGWAQLISDGFEPIVHKMVMNIGKRPTFDDGDGVSVEAHLLQLFDKDFYGEELKLAVLGYIRPEMKFHNLDDLIKRMQWDIDIARSELDSEPFKKYKENPFFA